MSIPDPVVKSIFSFRPPLRHPFRARPWQRPVVTVLAALACRIAVAQTNDPAGSTDTNVVHLEATTVVGKLDEAREQIVPSLGATAYSVSRDQLDSQALGENAPFNQVILRTPGVAQDGLGQLHLRGEHANLQYRINEVLLPEGITGFGQELDTRFVDSLQLVTGSLPAQYGFRTAGIIDIHTKSGAFEPGGSASVYGGSYDTIKPSFEFGGSHSNLNFFVDGSYNHNGIGIENPTSSSRPIHDYTDQYKLFTYLSYILDDTSRISIIGSLSYSTFEIPNTPGLQPGGPSVPTNVTAVPWNQFLPTSTFNSATLDERQTEQNYYGVIAYQKSVGDLNLQVSAFGRNSSVSFNPDSVGDLFFNGVASHVERTVYAGGLQGDASYALNDQHTVRSGLLLLDAFSPIHTTTTVFPVDGNGNPTGAPFSIPDNNSIHALFFGLYLQDEWKLTQKLTLNYGARFDLVDSIVDENQLSPRINAIYQATKGTALHAGYSRYFTPPALEAVPASSVTKFNGTSNGSEVTRNDPPRSERSDYFDAGVTHKLLEGLQVGLDGYYKKARYQLDDGLFGASLIPAQFNYHEGEVYGAEFTTTYTKGGFSAFANVAYSVAKGKEIVSGQFLFGQDDLNYIKNNYVHLDHDQEVTGSFGASYLWRRSDGSTRVYVDALYGSGLRTDATAPDGSTIPNGGTVSAYYSINTGIEEAIKFHGKEHLKLRLDVVNLTDNVYQLRDGAGIGVNAAQYGMRLGFFGTVSLVF